MRWLGMEYEMVCVAFVPAVLVQVVSTVFVDVYFCVGGAVQVVVVVVVVAVVAVVVGAAVVVEAGDVCLVCMSECR